MNMQLCFEDVVEGTPLPPLVKETYYMQLVEYASASRDFYIIHHDRDYAKSVGLPDVIIQGSLKAAFLGQLVTDWMGQEGTLTRFAVQYRGIDVPGKPLTAKGIVSKTYPRGEERCVECDLWIENTQGERTTKGTAVIVLPTRSGA
jgi:acyl dehydratase